MRSLLFVPGDDARKLDKALASGADALIVDLEDSVAPSRKVDARRIAAEFLKANAGPGRPRLLLRVNPAVSGLLDADVEAVMPAVPTAIVLPKSESASDVVSLAARLAVAEAEWDLADGSTAILPIITETAASLFHLGSYRGCSRRLLGLTWGGEDLSADLGAETNRLDDGSYADVYRLARSLTLLAAVAAEVAPVDSVFTAFRDETGLRREALAARRDGFTGKMAIHPAQVPVINEVFTPSPEAVARARAIVAAFAADPAAGVVGLDGEMIDKPHLRRAERILAAAAASR